jgi:hypothetical protein
MKKNILIIFLVLIFGYFIGIPFIINHILVPIQNYQTSLAFKEIGSIKTTDEDFAYNDKFGNKIIIWDFQKNVSNIEKDFFEKKLSGEIFKEETDSVIDKFEFKIVEFKKIDTFKYILRVRKAKIQNEKISNNRKYLNYVLELDNNNNQLKIKKCNLISTEVD